MRLNCLPKKKKGNLMFQHISPTKICFEPNREKRPYDEIAQKIRLELSVFPVYLYNERTGVKDMDIKLKLPSTIVKSCMCLIKEKDDQKRKYKAKTLKDDMGLHNMKQKMQLQVKCS